jgi:hypothetical protein
MNSGTNGGSSPDIGGETRRGRVIGSLLPPADYIFLQFSGFIAPRLKFKGRPLSSSNLTVSCASVIDLSGE